METSTRDDIDLQELAVRIIRYFTNHLVFILISSAVGLGLGVLAFRSLPDVYESQMIVLSDLLTKTYGDRIDRALNGLIQEGNVTELSARLGLAPEKAATLRSIRVESQLDVKTPQREKVDRDETYFIITANLTDRSILPDLQEAMMNYLRNNELVKVRSRHREEMAKVTINRIDKELRSIDSLKKLLFQKNPIRSETLQFEPSNLFTTAVNLEGMRSASQHELELATSIHLVEGFTAFQKPKDPKLTTLVFAGLFIGFFSAIGLLTLRHLFKLARN